MSSGYLILPLIGHLAKPHLRRLAELKLTIFREYPYLLDGDPESEERSLERYADSPDSLFLIAFRENRIVGASVCLPMECAADEIRSAVSKQGYDPARIFYFAESFLPKEFRDRDIGIRFFEEGEKHARQLGQFEYTAFRAAERPETDPRKPSDYVSPNRFWQTRGYVRRPDMVICCSWQDSGETSESSKPMVFWMKSLAWGDLR